MNDTIARPSLISDPMHFLSHDDTGAPTRDLAWYEVDVDYSHNIIHPGRAMDEFGLAAALSCPLETKVCKKNEILFNMDLASGRLPQDVAVIVELYPIYYVDMDIQDYIHQEHVGVRTDNFNETAKHFYDTIEVVPVVDE